MVFSIFSYFLCSLQTAMAVFSSKFHVLPSKFYLQLLWCNSWLHRQISLMKIVDCPGLSARRHLNSLWNTCVVCSFHWKFQMNKRFFVWLTIFLFQIINYDTIVFFFFALWQLCCSYKLHWTALLIYFFFFFGLVFSTFQNLLYCAIHPKKITFDSSTKIIPYLKRTALMLNLRIWFR